MPPHEGSDQPCPWQPKGSNQHGDQQSMHAVSAFIDAVMRAAGTHIGKEIARALCDWVARLFARSDTASTPSALEIDGYLRGSIFAPFTAERVQRDAYIKFSARPVAERTAVIVTAIARTNGDPISITKEIVAYVNGRSPPR